MDWDCLPLGWGVGTGHNAPVQYTIEHGPSFANARVVLSAGETIRAESGAMAGSSVNVRIETQSGGLGKMFGRLLTGESIFQTTFTADGGPGEVILAPKGVGDIIGVQVAGRGLMITSGCFLACDATIELKTVAEWKGMFGGEGLFMMRTEGTGTVLMSTFGAYRVIDLQPGQAYVIDSGHIVAFEEGMRYQVRKATRSLMGALTSGEGVVCVFEGPGRIWMQTHQARGFAELLSTFIPSRG